ncbi:hypothetical protein PMAYCL1PPCAC_33287 [Pristionchus mayeri]|uniref:RRM domain-containing protein n=1 Tax=Pristionchus mayeri TaxID=1317129 RepID=A0AAN5DI17_9BILA|nr:hypothetical protein PMAYCL1PPCAC_33287 [Pristionchus mayeri]
MSVIIRLQGLPLSAASADIRAFFSGLRIPDGAVNIVGGDDGDAFIGFATDEDARQAMRKNHGQIHNAEVRLHLSSRSEMNEVIDRARSAPSMPMNPPALQPPAYVPPTSRYEREEQPRFQPREEPSRFGRDIPSYARNGPQFGREEPQRYGRSEPPAMSGNGRAPFAQHGGYQQATRPGYEAHFDTRKEEGEKMRPPTDRLPYEMHLNEREKSDQRKSDDMGGRNAPWMMGRDRERMGDNEHQRGYGGYPQPQVIRQEDDDRRQPMSLRDVDTGMVGNIRQDGDERKDTRKKEESWRSENNRSFERMPPLHGSNGSAPQEEEAVSFFGRGPPLPKRTLLPPPSMPAPQMPSIAQSHLPTQPSPPDHKPKEEVFVELTRLPPDLLRPSVLEEFLAPATPLTLSSVKVVYSPEGIHLHSLVRFTSAMDAFNALKKDGEQGVKIRPSTKEAFDVARDGPIPAFVPPTHPPVVPAMAPFPPVMPMGGGGIMHPGMGRMGQLPMPLMNPNEMMMIGNDRRGSGEMDEGRGERRRRQDSPPRGRREERRRRSNSPRAKKPKVDRVCVHISNLPFRVKEPEIRRMLGPGLNPFAIKKVFTEDNTPSDVWIMEFSSEPEAMETTRRRMELGGRQVRLRMLDEPEADRLLRQKFKSPPRRTEKEERRDSFDEKVRMQQEAIEMEKTRQNGPGRMPSGETGALAGAFSAPVFTTNRGFMRGGRGGPGRGMMRGGSNGPMKGGRGGLLGGPPSTPGNVERNCLLVSNMPPLPAPQVLLEHLRISPPQLVRVDQIAPDAAIIELRGEKDAVVVAEHASGPSFPNLHGRRLIVAAMGRRQIEEEFNLRGAGEVMERGRHSPQRRGHSPPPHRPRIDPEVIRSIGEPGCVISCDGFPRDLAIDEVAAFFDGFPMVEASVRMRMENGEGTGECMLAMGDRSSARRAVNALHGKRLRGNTIKLSLLE